MLYKAQQLIKRKRGRGWPIFKKAYQVVKIDGRGVHDGLLGQNPAALEGVGHPRVHVLQRLEAWSEMKRL